MHDMNEMNQKTQKTGSYILPDAKFSMVHSASDVGCPQKQEALYAPIIRKLEYWRDYTGTGDRYRQEHDFDCLMTGGNLHADCIVSLWLPLRATLNAYAHPAWEKWKDFEYEELRPKGRYLKDSVDFLNNLITEIEAFLPLDGELTGLLSELFDYGQRRSNVMLLPYRSWNTRRGGRPYFDYMPHFLFDLLHTESPFYRDALQDWIRQEHLEVFFRDGQLDAEHLKDPAGTGAPWRHSLPEMDLPQLLKSYIEILKERERLIA